MTMTNAEIIASYRQAKNRKAQVGILADLNACSRKEIKAILGDVADEAVEKDTTYRSAFKARLNELMGERTAVEMAKHCGVCNTAMHCYLAGTTMPKIGGLISIAKTFGVSVDWLLGLEK